MFRTLIRIGATRRNLQAELKMLEKIVGISNQPKYKNFPKKTMFVPSKCKKKK
jgi:hypothetical protein